MSDTLLNQLLSQGALTPQDAQRDSVDYGARVQNDALRTAVGLQKAERDFAIDSSVYEAIARGLTLQQQGQKEIDRLDSNDNPISGIINIVKNPKRGLRDELGISRKRAKEQIKQGQQLVVAADSRGQLLKAQSNLDSMRAQALLGVMDSRYKLADEIDTRLADRGKEARMQREAALAESKHRLEVANAQRKNIRDAKADFLAGANATQLDAILSQFPEGAQTIQLSDAATQTPFNVTRPELQTFVRKKQLEEAEVMTSLLAAEAGQEEHSRALQRSVLEKKTLKQLQGLALAEGYEVLLDAEGNEVQVQFNVADVNAVLNERKGEDERNLAIAGQLQAATRFEQVNSYIGEQQAAGVDTNSPDFVENVLKEFPLTSEGQEAFDTLMSAGTIYDVAKGRITSAFQGEVPDSVSAQFDVMNGEILDANRLAGEIIAGRLQPTTENLEKIRKASQGMVTEISKIKRSAAQNLASGDKELESFIYNVLDNAVPPPAQSQRAFESFASSGSNAFSAFSAPSTKHSISAYNKEKARLLNELDAQRGQTTTRFSEGNPESMTLEALIAAAGSKGNQRSSRITKEEYERINRTALVKASEEYRNYARDSLLQGDFSIFPPEVRQRMAQHPIGKVNLRSAFSHANNMFDQKLSQGLEDEAANAFFVEYIKRLRAEPSPLPDFDSAYDVFVDFLGSESYVTGLTLAGNGRVEGNFADKAAGSLLGPQAFGAVYDDIQTILTTGVNIDRVEQENLRNIQSSYFNNGWSRAEAILYSMDDTVIDDYEAGQLIDAMRSIATQKRRGVRVGAANAAQSLSNEAVEHLIRNQKLDDPALEEIRKRAAKQWDSVAPVTDQTYKKLKIEAGR